MMKWWRVLGVLGAMTFLMSSEVNADPPLPLPRMPICGDQDDSTDPLVYHCSDLIPTTDVQAFQVPGTGSVNLVFDFVFREATYNNELGFYEVDDASGAVGELQPGDPGYLAAALDNATIVFPSGSNAYTSDVSLQFDAGDTLVFFIVQGDTLERFQSNNPNNDVDRAPLAFFSLDSLNPDDADHFVGFDSATEAYTQFGFEDMTDGGDLDYDDVVYNIIPPVDFVCEEGSWKGEYFDNRDLQGDPVLLRCDRDIDFFWGTAAPGHDVPPNDFSVRWSRSVDITRAGWYRFRTFSDDGVRLYVDNELVIDDWTAHAFEEKSALIELTQGEHLIRMEYVEWSQDAMAYLNWYLCPEGKSDCSMDITPMYQTWYLDVPMPSDCEDEPNQTIARWGCAITSVAMALRHSGVEKTPAQLNEWLTPDGYDGGPCTAYLKWDEILKFAAEPEQGEVNLKWQSKSDASSVIRDKGLPVILQVAGGGHYALAVDVIEDHGIETLGINDPHHSWACEAIAASEPPTSVLSCTGRSLKHATTVSEELTYRGESSALKYLEVSSEPRTASLQFSISGAEVLLTDTDGRRVGYDAVAGQPVLEIPNSFYYDLQIIPPGGESSGTLERTLYLPENAGGVYYLRVIPGISDLSVDTTQTEFEIRAFGYDEDFTPSQAHLSSALEEGKTGEYMIVFEPGESLKVSPLSRIYLPLILHS